MSYRFLVSALLITLFLSVSCDDFNDPVWGNLHYGERVNASLTTIDGVPTERSEYLYAENKLVARVDFERRHTLWVESQRNLMTYQNDRVLCEWQYPSAGGWKTDEMMESRYRNGKIVEEIIYAPTETDLWIPDFRLNYTYNGSKITGWTGFKILPSGIERPTAQGTMNYENDLLRSALLCIYSEQGMLLTTDRKDLLYMEGRLTGYIQQFTSVPDARSIGHRVDYRYASNLLSEVYYFTYNSMSGNWETMPAAIAYFDYSQNGSLVGSGFESDISDTYTSYGYERGSGNARFFEKTIDNDILGYPTLRNTTTTHRISSYAEKLFQEIR